MGLTPKNKHMFPRNLCERKKHMKQIIISLITSMLVLLSFSSGTSETLYYAIFQAPPFMIGAEKQEHAVSGIDVDIVLKIAEKTHLDIEFIRCPWTRCLKMMESGEVDILSSAYKTPERELYMRYFDIPFLRSLPISFYFRKGTGYKIESYEDLRSLESIGVLRGASYFQRFDKDTSLNKTEVATQDQLFPMLLQGRFEAMAGYVPTENYRILTEGYGGKIEKSAYEYREPADVYMAISRKSSFIGRFDELNAINAQLFEQGIIQEIVDSYYKKFTP